MTQEWRAIGEEAEDELNRQETFFAFYDEDDADDECYECGGEGWVTADCFEDTCCCSDPECSHGVEPCPICNPEGRE